MSLRSPSSDFLNPVPGIPLHIQGGRINRELFRQVFVALALPSETQPLIAVASAVAGEGRTSVALGLAETLADDLACTVTLIDADFEHPAITQRFEMRDAHGLSDVLRGERRYEDVGTKVSRNLRVVPIGSAAAGASSLLRQMTEIAPFRLPGTTEGITIIDLPPLLSEAYSGLAAQSADAIILVVRAGAAPADDIRAAIGRLENADPRGVVFIDAPPPRAVQWFSRLLKVGRRRS